SRNFQSYFLSSPRFQSTSLFPYTTLFRSKGTSGFCAFLCQQFLNIEIQCELVGMRPQTDSVHFLQTLVFQPGFNHVLREDIAPRSEERRVGKEYRSRSEQDNYKKNKNDSN